MVQVAYMLITTKYGKEREVSEELMKHKEVEDVHILYGQFDIILKIKAKDMAEVEKFILDKVRGNKDIESTETLIASDVG
jgi:DNA-binding Lrp family transcriptional regulator